MSSFKYDSTPDPKYCFTNPKILKSSQLGYIAGKPHMENKERVCPVVQMSNITTMKEAEE